MVRIGLVGVVIGCVLGYFTYTEATLLKYSSAVPEEMTCEALIARGPDGNANVVLTDFFGCMNIVQESDKKNEKHWTWVHVPLVPGDEKSRKFDVPPTATNFKVLLSTPNAHNAQELEGVLNRPKLKGMVTNRISSMKGDVRNLLKQNYPNADFDKCIIFEEGRAPKSTGVVMGMGAGAAALVLVGIGFMLLSLRKG